MKKRMMWKVGVVCVISVLVLLSACKDAKLEAGERQLVKASLGGGEVRSGRSRRAVASGNASAQNAYYQSKFRVKLKGSSGVGQYLTLNSEGTLELAAGTEGYDASQIWYFDYDGYIFSLSGGKKSCLYQSKVIDDSYATGYLHYEVLVAKPVMCNQSYYKVNEELFKVKLERAEEDELYFTTTRHYDERGEALDQNDLMRSKEANKAYLGSQHGGKLVFDKERRHAFSVELEVMEDEEVSPAYKNFTGYYVNFVESEEKQLPFFTNKKSGKHAYIGKEVLIHDLYRYKVAYYKESVSAPSEVFSKNKIVPKPRYRFDFRGAPRVVPQIDRPKKKQEEPLVLGAKSRVLLSEKVIALGTKLEDLAAPKVGAHEALIICMYNAEGQLVDGQCTGSSKKLVGNYEHAISAKPRGYYYEGLDASKIAIANEEYKIKDDLYRLYSDGGAQVYINPNKFWHALNVVIPKGVKWEMETSYLPKRALAESEQRNNVKLLLPLYVDNIGMIGGYITGAQTLYEMKIGSAEEEGALGVVKVVYTDKGTWDGRNYTPPEAETAEFRYEFKGKVVAERSVPIVKGKLQALPVLAVFVDLEAKKLLAQIGESSWDWGSGPRISLDERAGGVVSLSSLSEASVKGLSGGMKFTGGESKHGIQFFMPELERNVGYSLQDVGLGKSRQRRWAFLAKLFGFGARGASMRYFGGRAYARLGYVARGAMRLSKMARLRRVLSLNRFKILGAGIGGGTAIGFIAAGAGGAFTPSHGKAEDKKQLHPSLSKDAKAVLLRRNAAGSYRSDGKQQVKSKAAWDELCAIGAGNDTSCVNAEVGVSGSYEGKSLNYKVVYTRKRDNTKEKRVEGNVSLACFHTNEKLSGQVYNYLCVTEETPTRVYTTVKPGDKRTKQKIRGNAIYLFIDKKNSLKDVKLHAQSMKKIEHKGGIGTDEHLLIAKLPSILAAANEPEMTIIDTGTSGNNTAIIRRVGANMIFFNPPSAQETYQEMLSIENGNLVYAEKNDEKVSFICPRAVPGGGIYRCEASKAGQYRVSNNNRILRNAATSDGITNETAQLHPENADFGPGTAYWGGSGSHDYIETRPTPKNYIDVWFADEAKISMIAFKTKTKSGRELVIKHPVGIVNFTLHTLDIEMASPVATHDVENFLSIQTSNLNKFFVIDPKFLNTMYVPASTTNVRLNSPEGDTISSKLMRVGFVQVVDRLKYELDLYSDTNKKMYSISIDPLLGTENRRTFKQYGTSQRIYPYVHFPVKTPLRNSMGLFFLNEVGESFSFFLGNYQQGSQGKISYLQPNGTSIDAQYFKNKVGHLTIIDKHLIDPVSHWIKSIDANVSGARPYRYRAIFEITIFLTVGVSDEDISDIAQNVHLVPNGIYNKLGEIKLKIIQEVGYSRVEDIGDTSKATVNYSYYIKGAPEQDSKVWMRDFVKATHGNEYYFRTVEKNGQRVLYYNKSIQEAKKDKDIVPVLKTNEYIRTHWKEVSTSE